MSDQFYLRACAPCKRRKSKCGKVKPCPSCIVYGTQDSCYSSVELPLPPLLPRQDSASSSSSTLRLPIRQASASLPSPLSEVDITFASQSQAGSVRQGKRKAQDPLQSDRSGQRPIEDTYGQTPDLVPFAPVNECELAFYSFVTEIQWTVTMADDRIRNVFRQFIYNGEAHDLEKAYLYLVLALVGKMASESFISIHAPTVRDAAMQARYLEAAETMIFRHTSTSALLLVEDSILVGQIHLLHGQYCMTLDDAVNCLKHFKAAANCAVTAGQVADTSETDLTQSLMRFRAETSVADVWISYMMDQSPIDALDDVIEYIASPQDDPIDARLLHQKVQAKVLVKVTRDLLHQSQAGSLEWATDLLTQEEIVEEFCNTLTYPDSSILVNNMTSFKTIFTTNTIRLFLLGNRLRLLVVIANVNVPSNAAQKRLQVACDILKETQRSLSLLQAPWRRMISTVGNSLHVEHAMSIFASTILESGISSAEEVKERQSAASASSTILAPPAALVSFITKFDAIYNMLNTLGFLGKSASQCAQLLHYISRNPMRGESQLRIEPMPSGEEVGSRSGQADSETTQDQLQSLSTILAEWLGSEMDLNTLEGSLFNE